MTVVLTGPEIDRAEAFRLSKQFRLPPEVSLCKDSSVLRFGTFCDLYGLDSMIILRIRNLKLNSGMASEISGSACYADRLSHFSDLDRPVLFEDLRGVLPGTTPIVSRPASAEGGWHDEEAEGPEFVRGAREAMRRGAARCLPSNPFQIPSRAVARVPRWKYVSVRLRGG